MQTIQSIQTVTGPTLTIAVPASFQGKEVKVVVEQIETRELTAEEQRQALIRAHIMPKPTVSAELHARIESNPDLLKTGGYDDPFGPAVPIEDWEVLRDPS